MLLLTVRSSGYLTPQAGSGTACSDVYATWLPFAVRRDLHPIDERSLAGSPLVPPGVVGPLLSSVRRAEP
jgi:hypothetical protein